jgi:hypothetical protein
MLYFQIVRNAKANKLRVDVEFKGGNAYRFNHNSATWSYDGENWRPILWRHPKQPSKHKPGTRSCDRCNIEQSVERRRAKRLVGKVE